MARQSLNPEPGWKRIDDTDKGLTYSNFATSTSASQYQGSARVAGTGNNSTVSFTFTGTKLRVIADKANVSTNPVINMAVTIDGVTETVVWGDNSNTLPSAIIYEKTGLTNTSHTVTIARTGSNTLSNATFQGVEIDLTGSISGGAGIGYVSRVEDLSMLGTAIPAQYAAASSNVYGTITNLGDGVNSSLGTSSPVAAPSGLFNFIYAGNDLRGRKVLIADRAVHLVTWRDLNNAGVVSGLTYSNNGYGQLSPTFVYVDPVNGLDTNNGTSTAPFKGLNAAINASGNYGTVILYSGIHTIDTANGYLHDLATTKNLTYIGTGLGTIIEVPTTPTAYAQAVGTGAIFSNMIIRPSSTFSKPQLWYNTNTTAPNFVLRFYNVWFTRDTGGTQPSAAYFTWGNTSAASPDVKFYNCAFNTAPTAVETQASSNVLRFYNCATGNTSYSPGSSATSLASSTFGADGSITSAGWQNAGTGVDLDGSIADIGLYGGLYAWNKYNVSWTKSYIRMPTGGISATDTANEWDSIVVNSTLGGNITAGDKAVWNWAAVSWTSTVSTSGPNYRSSRGGAAVTTYTANSTATTSSSFRPVLVVESQSQSLPKVSGFNLNGSGTASEYSNVTIISGAIAAGSSSESYVGISTVTSGFSSNNSFSNLSFELNLYTTQLTSDGFNITSLSNLSFDFVTNINSIIGQFQISGIADLTIDSTVIEFLISYYNFTNSNTLQFDSQLILFLDGLVNSGNSDLAFTAISKYISHLESLINLIGEIKSDIYLRGEI
jgi:hypothetical protein